MILLSALPPLLVAPLRPPFWTLLVSNILCLRLHLKFFMNTHIYRTGYRHLYLRFWHFLSLWDRRRREDQYRLSSCLCHHHHRRRADRRRLFALDSKSYPGL